MAQIRMGAAVAVINPDSIYRGERGTVVPLDARRAAKLDNYRRQRVRDGAILVERSNGSLFVVNSRDLAFYSKSTAEVRRYPKPPAPPRRFVAPRVADFNTLDDLIAHAGRELGATHVSSLLIRGTGEGEVKLYFPRSGQYPYEEARTWRKGGYWHAEGPGARTGVSRLPSDAVPIEQFGRRPGQRRSFGYTDQRIAREENLTKRFRAGSRVVMSPDALENYGDRWQGIVFTVTHVATSHNDHPGFDPGGGSALYDLAIELTGEPFNNSLYDWELEPVPASMKPRRRTR